MRPDNHHYRTPVRSRRRMAKIGNVLPLGHYPKIACAGICRFDDFSNIIFVKHYRWIVLTEASASRPLYCFMPPKPTA
jgi:hypothetical protein